MRGLRDLLKRLRGEPDFDVVREQLRNADQIVRMRAVASLRRSRDPRAIDLLFDALGDESHHVKNAAIELLVARPTRERVTRLIGLVTTDDPNRRLAAAKILHRLREPSAADALAGAVEHPSDSGLRQEAIEALGKIGGARAVDALIQKLEDDTEDEEPRALAANSLVDIGDPAAIEPLARVLAEIRASAGGHGGDPLGATVAEALDQLSAMHPGTQRARKPAAGSLVKRLADPDAARRVKAAEALGRRHDKAAIEPLITRLSDPEAAVRAAAAAALGKIGDRRAVGPIARLTRDLALADPSTVTDLGREGLLVCDAASAALGALGGAEAEVALLEALESDSAEVRMPAAGALRKCVRSRRILDALARLLDDSSPEVSCAAIAGLSDWKRAARDTTADYTDAELLSVLERAVRHQDHEVRFQALCSLDKFWPTPTARGLLRDALEDSHEMVREQAIQVLAQHKAADTIPRILEMLRLDSAPRVRAAAAEAVGLYFARPQDMEALIAALDDPESMVRASAASALRYPHELGAKPHPDAVPRLIELLSRETDGFVREAAQRSLAAFGVSTP